MKKLISKILPAAILLIGAFIVLGGCEKEKENKNPLKNTEWKLVSIVDTVSNKSKVPEPNRDDNFIMKFQKEDIINGFLSVNEVNGKYYVDYKQQTIKISITSSTFAEDSPDGYTFLQYIKRANKFVIDKNTLRLCYNDIVYLEFRRR